MNENLNLVEILKDCPRGTKLYSPVVGEVTIKYINNSFTFPICVEWDYGYINFTKAGLMHEKSVNGECMLFPSKDQRDWSKFKAPWYKKEQFDPKTLKPLDTVLAKDSFSGYWRIGIFSHYIENDAYSFKCVGNNYKFCIPYNEETKHLVGTTEEAPEFYRYWED